MDRILETINAQKAKYEQILAEEVRRRDEALRKRDEYQQEAALHDQQIIGLSGAIQAMNETAQLLAGTPEQAGKLPKTPADEPLPQPAQTPEGAPKADLEGPAG